MTEPANAPIERRHDGRTEHADWCSDHRHEGKCLDVLLAKIEEDE